MNILLRCWRLMGATGELRHKVLTPPLPSQPRSLTIRHMQRISAKRTRRWHPGGVTDWSLSDWACAMAGEAGEACNVVKKLNRVRDGVAGNRETPEELKAKLGGELSDNILYAVLVAEHEGIDLEQALIDTFNAKSIEQGFPERLP